MQVKETSLGTMTSIGIHGEVLVDEHTKVPDHLRRMEDAVACGQSEICLAQLGYSCCRVPT